MIVNPVFQTERQGPPGLSCFGWERLLGLKKSLATVVENFHQPIRNAVFDFQDRADPQVELLPVDVLIASLKQTLPEDAAGLSISAFVGKALYSGDVLRHRDPVSDGQFESLTRRVLCNFQDYLVLLRARSH